jgi:hypothetical protein
MGGYTPLEAFGNRAAIDFRNVPNYSIIDLLLQNQSQKQSVTNSVQQQYPQTITLFRIF